MESARLVDLATGAGLPFLGPVPVVDGDDPTFAYPLAIGEAAATVHALATDAAATLWARRGGPPTTGRLSVRHAAASLASFALLRLVGRPLHTGQWDAAGGSGSWRPWGADAVLRGDNATDPVVGLYRTRDGRWLHLHGGAPRLAERILAELRAARERPAIAAAVAGRDADELEDALADAGTCGAVARTADEWRAHPQGRALADLDTVDIGMLGAPVELPPVRRTPLDGVRVLDLGDGLAGPSCARTLARYGADVLQVVSPDRPYVEPFVLDTGHGKRSTFLDLSRSAGRRTFLDLVETAQVVCRSYRADALGDLGLGDDVLRQANGGLVIAQVSCYGPVGPWADRRGWEQLGQVATGLALRTSTDDVPRLAPAALCDYLTGYLAAVGVLRALVAGSGAAVRASLCQSAMWLLRSDLAIDETDVPDPTFGDLQVTSEVHQGTLHHLPPVDHLAPLPTRWRLAPPVPGEHPSRWARA